MIQVMDVPELFRVLVETQLLPLSADLMTFPLMPLVVKQWTFDILVV